MTSAPSVPHGAPNPDAVDGSVDRTDWVAAIPFFGVHLVPLAAFFVVVTWQDWVLCAALYVSRMFFITAGYHRYFSHRSYRMGRVRSSSWPSAAPPRCRRVRCGGPATIGSTTATPTSMTTSTRPGTDSGGATSVGSCRPSTRTTDLAAIKDFAAYPELRFLERRSWIGPWLVAIGCFLIGGWGGLVIGFFLSTVLLWHGTFLVNSMAHLMGRRRYATPDTSRNSAIIAVITGGEGWHNNHHYLPASARQGFTWWEIDPTWYLLRGLSLLRVVRDIKDPPARLLQQARVRDGAFDIGMFRSYWERAAKVTGERIADLSGRPMAPSAEASDPVPPPTAGRRPPRASPASPSPTCRA